MDRYTLVVEVPEGLSLETLVEIVEAVERGDDGASPVVTFCGPINEDETGGDAGPGKED